MRLGGSKRRGGQGDSPEGVRLTSSRSSDSCQKGAVRQISFDQRYLIGSEKDRAPLPSFKLITEIWVQRLFITTSFSYGNIFRSSKTLYASHLYGYCDWMKGSVSWSVMEKNDVEDE